MRTRILVLIILLETAPGTVLSQPSYEFRVLMDSSVSLYDLGLLRLTLMLDDAIIDLDEVVESSSGGPAFVTYSAGYAMSEDRFIILVEVLSKGSDEKDVAKDIFQFFDTYLGKYPEMGQEFCQDHWRRKLIEWFEPKATTSSALRKLNWDEFTGKFRLRVAVNRLVAGRDLIGGEIEYN